MAERTLVQKLGLKPGMVACKVNAPPEYQELVQEADVDWLDHMVLEAEFIHVFTTTIDELWALVQAGKYHMSVSGALWISWPKKASGIESSISFGVCTPVRAGCRPGGYQGVFGGPGMVRTEICLPEKRPRKNLKSNRQGIPAIHTMIRLTKLKRC